MKPIKLTRELFNELTSKDGSDLVSIFIPTHTRGREVDQDRIRLKNGLASVDGQLETMGWKPRQRADRLSEAESLLDDREFWEHQSNGLAVYIDEVGGVTAVASSVEFKPDEFIMPVFLMRPLVLDLDTPSIPVLALARQYVALYEVRPHDVIALDSDLPGSMEDVNWFVDRERQRQQHPDRAGTTQNKHGHRDSGQSDEDLTRFLREVARALPAADSDRPLVVLGDDDLASRFANIATRPVISPENSGIGSTVTEFQIYEMALPVLEGLREERRNRDVVDAIGKLGTGRGTTEIEEAIPDAVSGRIESVVIDGAAKPLWGRFDQATLDVIVHDDRTPADVDLLDRLVVLAMKTDAQICAVDGPVDGREFIATHRF